MWQILTLIKNNQNFSQNIFDHLNFMGKYNIYEWSKLRMRKWVNPKQSLQITTSMIDDSVLCMIVWSVSGVTNDWILELFDLSNNSSLESLSHFGNNLPKESRLWVCEYIELSKILLLNFTQLKFRINIHTF